MKYYSLQAISELVQEKTEGNWDPEIQTRIRNAILSEYARFEWSPLEYALNHVMWDCAKGGDLWGVVWLGQAGANILEGAPLLAEVAAANGDTDMIEYFCQFPVSLDFESLARTMALNGRRDALPDLSDLAKRYLRRPQQDSDP